MVLEGILNLIINEEGNKFKKIIMMEMFCIDTAKSIMERELFIQAREYLSKVFEIMMKKGVIKEYNPLVLANQFLAPLMFINLEYLLDDKKDIEYIKEHVKAHIDFFLEAINI